jgi:hypothetical protein
MLRYLIKERATMHRGNKVILVGRDMMNNRYYKLDGMSKRYNRHELLLVD